MESPEPGGAAVTAAIRGNGTGAGVRPGKHGAGPIAVVLGLDGPTGLQTARILSRRNVPVVGVASRRRHPCALTRSCRRVVRAELRGPALVDELLSLAPSLGPRAVLFPCTDASVLAVSRHRDALEPSYHVILPPRETVEIVLDKARFYALAQEKGIPIPRTFLLRERSDAERAARELPFPAILKPAEKTPEWERRAGAKAFRTEDPERLLELYDRCREWTDVLVAQERVPGGDPNHVTCNAYLGDDGEPLVTFTTRKLRQWPAEGGQGCLGESFRSDIVRAQALRTFRLLGLRGLAYLETKLDERTGRHVVIEPSVGRPTGRSATAEAAGVELLYTQYCDALGWELPGQGPPAGQGVKWVHLRRDAQAALRRIRGGELTASEWVDSLRGRRTYAVFSWTDPVPFVADLLRSAWKAAAGWIRSAVASVRRDRGAPAAGRSGTREGGVAGAGGRGARSGRRTGAGGHDGTRASSVDFDVHGIVGVRLVGPTEADVEAVSRQIGPPAERLERDPDLTLRFADSLGTPDLRYVGLETSGFTSDGFFLLRSKRKETAVRIDFRQVGGSCELVCERGLRAVPLLVPLVTLTAAARGWVPLHASAFVHEGVGALVAGWAEGGKTEALLAFAAEGAEYVGDEWVLVGGENPRMCGIPQEMRLYDWQLRQLPEIRERAEVPAADRLLWSGIRGLDRIQRRIPDGGVGRSWPVRRLRAAMPGLRRATGIQLDVPTVFGDGALSCAADVDRLFLVVSHPAPETRVEPMDAGEIARRMAVSVRYEQTELFRHYLAYRFAFPDRENPFLEEAHELQARLLRRSLAGLDAWEVRHPQPCSLEELYHAMRPYCEPGPADVGPTPQDKPEEGCVRTTPRPEARR